MHTDGRNKSVYLINSSFMQILRKNKIDSPLVEWLDFVTNVSSLLRKTLGYRQEIIIGPIMIFCACQPCINSCSYCTLGVSAQSTRLQIPSTSTCFRGLKADIFPFLRTLLYVPFCLKTSIFCICTG